MLKINRSDIRLARELNKKFFGNSIGEQKELLIRNRLKKLYRSYGGPLSLTQMLEEISHGKNVQAFINAFTTNKTSFFREPLQFEDLMNRVFPDHFAHSREIKIYSCASSTGEEPYSIGITLLTYLEQNTLPMSSRVYATDIDTDVLKTAQNGIYRFDTEHSPFPNWVRPQNFFQRRIVDGVHYVLIRANDKLRHLLSFSQYNLLDPEPAFAPMKFDVIFCRNVLIYFNNHDQEKVLNKLFDQLKIGGTLYTGHSETPFSLYSYIEKIGPSIFKKHSERKGVACTV